MVYNIVKMKGLYMHKRGFTLVEIMVVVTIIALLAAIAIPNLLRARLQSNESVAQAALKTIVAAEVTYRTANPAYGTLAELGAPSAGPTYIDTALATGTRSGYAFTATDIGPETFQISAVPLAANSTGASSYCVTEDGVIKVQADGSAIADRASCLALPATVR
jgi:type IV pilus assembly protein PilA